MKKMFERLIDEVFEMILGSLDIDLCDIKDEDFLTGAAHLGDATG